MSSLSSPHCGACRAERSQSVCPPYKLQLEECLTAEQVPTPELIQGYVKKVGARITNAKLKVLSVRAQLEGGKQGGRDGEGWMQRQCGGFLYIYIHSQGSNAGVVEEEMYQNINSACYQNTTLFNMSPSTMFTCLQLCFSESATWLNVPAVKAEGFFNSSLSQNAPSTVGNKVHRVGGVTEGFL